MNSDVDQDHRITERPCALTIAGSDSGGGAGIQADLHTFRAFGVHGTCVVTALTAQSPERIVAIRPIEGRMIRSQLEVVWTEFMPRAVKIGMLYHEEAVEVLVDFLRSRHGFQLVIDPIRKAGIGTPLSTPGTWHRAERELFPLATVLTPNLDEAEMLLGWRPGNVESMRKAAEAIHDRFGCAVVVKGGHLHEGAEAIDLFFDGDTFHELRMPRLEGVRTHGTGCLFSAAITACLARGLLLVNAVRMAKQWVHKTIREGFRSGKATVLGYHGYMNVESA